MSRLYDAIRHLAKQGDRAGIGQVSSYRGGGRYRVQIAGSEYDVPAVGDAQAMAGQSVAVLVSGETGQAVAMLGVIRQAGA